MSNQDVHTVPIVLDDANAFQQLKHAVDVLSTADASRFAKEAGVRPPTEEPDWELLVRAEPDGTESLLWVLVREDESV